jgi:hypothetical protein
MQSASDPLLDRSLKWQKARTDTDPLRWDMMLQQNNVLYVVQ